MFRYFAFVWDSANARQQDTVGELTARLRRQSPDWQCKFNSPGVRVLCADEQPRSLRCQCLDGNAGVIAGSLFERHKDPLDDTPYPRARLDEPATRRIIESQGKTLVEDYWGNYVAVLCEGATVAVVVSPSGRLPCFTCTIENITCVFACLTDALALGLPPPIRSHIYVLRAVLGQPPHIDNSLHEVTRLYRGESLRFRPSSHPPRITRQTLWDPHVFTQRSCALDDPALAANVLRSVVRACTQTLSRDYDHVHLRLSGGLDSSIIAGSLHGSSARVTCHTYFHRDTPADPRPWARLAATHGNYPIAEYEIRPEQQFLPMLAQLRGSVDIGSRLEYLSRVELERTLCEPHASAAVFTGDGGDAGLCSDCVALALTQHLQHQGFTRRTWSLARQIALATHRTLWDVLRQSVRRWRTDLPWFEPGRKDPQGTRLVTRSLLSRPLPELRHPWMRSDTRECALTCFRLGVLMHPIDEYDLSLPPTAFAPEVVHPLCAQPVVEMMLRIPVYVHFEQGRDRGLARRAFAQDASWPNLNRTWKDRAPGFAEQLIEQHLPWLRETLLDGVLVTEGYLDRSRVEAALATEPSRSDVNPLEILRHLDIELWTRQWTHH